MRYVAVYPTSSPGRRKAVTIHNTIDKMIERYECGLPPKVLFKAVEELNEPKDDVKRLKAIDELR